MTSVAEKRRRRKERLSNGGRPRDDAKRTPGGQKSRAQEQTEREAMSTVIQTRMRRHDCTETEARSHYWGFPAGIKYMNGHFGKNAQNLIDAGITGTLEIDRCRRIIGYPPLTARAVDLNKVIGRPLDRFVDDSRVASNHLMKLEGVLLQSGHGVKQAFHNCFLIEMEEAIHWPKHMNKILINGMVGLSIHYGLRKLNQN